MGVLSGLEPERVFYYFEEITKIPHGTYNTKAISDFCVEFAKNHNLEYIQDRLNNVIIKKPGTAGYETSEPVMLQGHLDMVCEKTDESKHDFEKDPLSLIIKDGDIYADNTTLGGDDGIAVAMTLAILEDQTIEHPPIEAVFTTEEEIGMDGAEALDFTPLKGKTLINIDSEEEGIFTVGCAGGLRVTSILPFEYVEKEGVVLSIKIKGLVGGHSGIEAHKQRGNAHVLMGRLLNYLNNAMPVHLIDVVGGSKDNVISRANTTRICIAEADKDNCLAMINEMADAWKNEFLDDEPELEVTVSEDDSDKMATLETSGMVIRYLRLMPNGVFGFERAIEGQVETSLNAGIVKTENDSFIISHMIRSSIESKKTMLKEQLAALAELCGGTSDAQGDYPAWAYRAESKLRDTMEAVFERVYGRKAEIMTIHAGLECGLFLGKRPELDCVSFGPDMFDVHSTNEHINIDSVTRSYKYLIEVLRELK